MKAIDQLIDSLFIIAAAHIGQMGITRGRQQTAMA